MLPSQSRMRRPQDFAAVLARGSGAARAGRRTVVLALAAPAAGSSAAPLVGFAVGRNVGNAVTRNRVRRRLQHCVRGCWDEVPPGSRLVVRALPAAASVSSADLCADVSAGLRTVARRSR